VTEPVRDPRPNPSQSVQRVKVGVIGLGAVMLLIALASIIIGSAIRERPVAVIGAPKAEVIANLAIDNGMAITTEPLAELGVAPSTNGQAPGR
jgi:hypothetical protein